MFNMKKTLTAVIAALTVLTGLIPNALAQGSWPANTATRWRGFPMAIGRDTATNNYARDNASWAALKSRGCSTIRICIVPPGGGQTNFFTNFGALHSVLDACVSNGERNGMNVIINYHTVQEFVTSTNFTQLHNWWNNIAPRYNNRGRVTYEICNEPCSGSRYTNATIRQGLMQAYRICRDRSNNGLLMFSFNALDYDFLAIFDNYNNWGNANPAFKFNWGRSGVAWHFYSGTWNNYAQFTGAFAKLNTIMYARSVRCICTELFTRTSESYVPDNINFIKELEKQNQFKQSWCAWRDWTDRSVGTWDVLKARAAREGYNW